MTCIFSFFLKKFFFFFCWYSLACLYSLCVVFSLTPLCWDFGWREKKLFKNAYRVSKMADYSCSDLCRNAKTRNPKKVYGAKHGRPNRRKIKPRKMKKLYIFTFWRLNSTNFSLEGCFFCLTWAQKGFKLSIDRPSFELYIL